MRTKYLLLPFFLLAAGFAAKAQDSAKVAQTLIKLLSICKNVDFNDAKVFEQGTFYQAAPYIIYQGDDKKRRWKTLVNYKNADEKEQVDQICLRINNSVNQDPQYKITRYTTNTESEGKWYVIHVSYIKNDKQRNAAFAFLKIGNKFALGDVD